MGPGGLQPPVHDGALPPTDLLPPPVEPTHPPEGQLNPMQKAAAALLSLGMPSIPEQIPEPPRHPGNLPPPVFNGVPLPNDLPPQPGDARRPRPDNTESSRVNPQAKAALAGLFGIPTDVLPPPLTSAAKLLADLESSDRTYLTASKRDDGTGHRVVTEKGKVLFLKTGSEKVGLLSRLPVQRLRQYRNTPKGIRGIAEGCRASRPNLEGPWEAQQGWSQSRAHHTRAGGNNLG
jgi:hypothetical protein